MADTHALILHVATCRCTKVFSYAYGEFGWL